MIILASQSPRRKELLKEILKDIPFEAIPSDFNERTIECNDCKKLCQLEAYNKGLDVAKNHLNDIIISSDTMVLYNGKQIGKPKDREDAKKTLQMLSDNTHSIITAYCIFKGTELLKKRVVEAALFIEKMSDYEIEDYLDSGSPFDKAGSYGVQDTDYINSKIIKGDMYTIMGLPIKQLEKDLKGLKII